MPLVDRKCTSAICREQSAEMIYKRTLPKRSKLIDSTAELLYYRSLFLWPLHLNKWNGRDSLFFWNVDFVLWSSSFFQSASYQKYLILLSPTITTGLNGTQIFKAFSNRRVNLWALNHSICQRFRTISAPLISSSQTFIAESRERDHSAMNSPSTANTWPDQLFSSINTEWCRLDEGWFCAADSPQAGGESRKNRSLMSQR